MYLSSGKFINTNKFMIDSDNKSTVIVGTN